MKICVQKFINEFLIEDKEGKEIKQVRDFKQSLWRVVSFQSHRIKMWVMFHSVKKAFPHVTSPAPLAWEQSGSTLGQSSKEELQRQTLASKALQS